MGNKKYYGKVGFAFTLETDPENHPGVWEEIIVEKTAVGDVLMQNIKNEDNDKVNRNININNQISILAAPYVLENLEHIVYATYLNHKWEVNNVKIAMPRLILTLGGVYNEQE